MGKNKVAALAAAALLALGSAARAEVIITPAQMPGAAPIASGRPVAWDAGSGSYRVVLPDGAAVNYLELGLTSGSAEGTISLEISLVGTKDLASSFPLSSGAQHFFTVHTTDGEALRAMRISSDVAVENVNLITIGGYAADGSAPVPEPAVFGLFSTAILALALRRRVRSARRLNRWRARGSQGAAAQGQQRGVEPFSSTIGPVPDPAGAAAEARLA